MLGVDLGTRRIGLALSDPARTTATPLRVLERSARKADDHASILAVADEYEADLVVVGLPLTLEGTIETAARKVLSEVDLLRQRAGESCPVVVHDERLSTVTAEQALLEGGLRREERRQRVDAVAAAVILQSWLDARGREGES